LAADTLWTVREPLSKINLKITELMVAGYGLLIGVFRVSFLLGFVGLLLYDKSS
jgi:hypothetical protein